MTTKANINSKTLVGAIAGAAAGTVAYLIIVGPGVNLALFGLALLGGGTLGGLLGLLIANKNAFSNVHGYQGDIKIQLREEHLDIIRKRIPAGDLKIHKEVITEEKTVTLPLTREELVIETRKTDGRNNENPETIRIPIREEQLDITKTPVALNDVSVFKHNIHETKHINATLKKETLEEEHTGNVIVTNYDHKPQD